MRTVAPLPVWTLKAVFTFCRLGNVKTISGQFKKSDLSAEHRLNVSVLVLRIHTNCTNAGI